MYPEESLCVLGPRRSLATRAPSLQSESDPESSELEAIIQSVLDLLLVAPRFCLYSRRRCAAAADVCVDATVEGIVWALRGLFITEPGVEI